MASWIKYFGRILLSHRTARLSPSCKIAATLSFSWFFLKKPTLQEEMNQIMRSSLNHIAIGQFEMADSELHEILRLLADGLRANKLDPREYVGKRARIFSELSNLKLMQQDYEMAEKLLVETMRDCINAGVSQSDPMIIELSLKLALVFVSLNEDEKAELGFAFCLQIQEPNLPPLDQKSNAQFSPEEINNLALFGMICNYYSTYLVKQGRHLEARGYAERALSLSELIYPADDAHRIDRRSDLATINSLLGEHVLARTNFSRTRDEALRVLSSEGTSVEFSIAYLNLLCQWALMEASLGAFKEARLLSSEASDIFSSENRFPHEKKAECRAKLDEVQRLLERWSSDSANEE